MTTGQKDVRRNIVGASIGNVMEWYDFAVYAYMAPILGDLFFPSDDPLESLIGAFGAFAAGYVSGPIGAVIFGHIGDKIGRKAMLLVSILMMGLATTAIGAMPVDANIGWAAGAGLVALRMLQGIASSGEYTGSLAFVCEHAAPKRRGFAASFILVGANVGFLLGGAVVALITAAFSDAAMNSWAWRLPFLIGGIVAIMGLFLRAGLSEPPTPEDYQPPKRLPLIVAFRDYWREMLKVGGLALTVNAGFYLIYVYILSYLITVTQMAEEVATEINIICLLIMSILPIGFAMLSDRIGRKPVLIIGNLGILALTYPLFILLDNSAFLPVLLGQVGFAVVFSWIWGANSAVQVEVAPRAVRATVMTIPVNIVSSIFIGTIPLVATYLVQETGDFYAPAFYLMGLSVLTLIAVIATREMAGKPLD
ncbi:MAG: MFS transporter [Pseudomonadota bacterium]